jgi:hypothetical protein
MGDVDERLQALMQRRRLLPGSIANLESQALHLAIITRIHVDERTKAYVARPIARAVQTRDHALPRALLARELFHLLSAETAS